MSTFLEKTVAIEAKFKADFGIQDIPIEYDNTKIETPKGSSWVRLTILNSLSDISGLGKTKRYRNAGTIMVQVFCPSGKNQQEALGIADSIADIWRGASFNGVVCRTPSINKVGSTNGWYQINVSVPFFWDEII